MSHVLETGSLDVLREALEHLDSGFEHLPGLAGLPEEELGRIRRVVLEAAERMRDNYPYFHPLYVGQMLKPPHPVARIAYALSIWINPNNHALDGGRASSAMEREAVAEIAAMFGWREGFLGHLAGGGTMANFEALWVARELTAGKAVLASAQAHYTHSRLASVLGVPFGEVAVDARGRMDLGALDERLARGDVGTVVATLGTTAAGAIDPLPEILERRETHGFRVHVDSAYGGYFTLCDGLGDLAAKAYRAIELADSVVVDPHKHGLQPYGCGCVLFRDAAVGRFYKHDSPYTYFSSPDLHLGEISLECSRPGAAAVALWTTHRLLPLERGGELARSLEDCRGAALGLYAALADSPRFAPLFSPELDIVVWAIRAESASESSALAQRLFDAAAKLDLHLALARFPRAMCEAAGAVETWDRERLTCLRACVMKADQERSMPEILDRLDRAAATVD